MARPDQQLSAYRELLDNARAMLLAAREARWDDLTNLETARKDCLSSVVEADIVSTIPAEIETRTELIQSILECDEQTKALVHGRTSELAEMLGSMDNERKLADAYRSG